MADIWDLAPRSAPTGGGVWDLAPVLGGTVPSPGRAKDIGDAIIAGVQSSATGLAVRGKMPSQELDAEAPWYHRAAYGLANVATDIPLSVVGAVAGAVAGGAVGSAVPVLGTAAGGFAGGAAGAFAAPMALRDGLIEAYNNNHALDWNGVWEIAKASAKGGGKGAVLGVATAGAGAVAGRVVGAAVAPGVGVTRTATQAVRSIEGAAVAAELATLTGTAAALEGKMPTWQDFMDNAILLGGMKGAIHVAKGMRNAYAETGKTPAEVVVDAAKDPQLKAELLGEFKDKSGEVLGRVAVASEFVTKNGDSVVLRYFPDDPSGASVRAHIGGVEVGILAPDIRSDGKLQPAAMFVAENYRRQGINTALNDFAAQVFKNFDPQSNLFTPDGQAFYDGVINKGGFGRTTFSSPTARVPEAYRQLATEQKIKAAILDSLDADPRPESIRQALTGNLTNTPKLDGKLLTDPVKYEYITDSATAQGVLRAVADTYQKEIVQQTRGEVPNKQTAAEAIRRVANGEVGERIIGQATDAADGFARAHMLKGATNHALREMEKLAALPDAEVTPAAKMGALAAIEQVAMLQAEFAGARAEAGRALQIYRAMKRDSSLLGDANFILAAAERKGSITELARFVTNSIKDPAQLAALAAEYAKPTFTTKLMYTWRSFILSGPQTYLANALGNIGKWSLDLVERPIAATIEAAGAAARGDPLTMAQWKARAFSPIIGFQQGALDGLKLAGEILKHGDVAGAQKYESHGPRPIEGVKGVVLDVPFRILQATDAMLRVPAQRAKAYQLAVDRAVKEGVHPETAEGRATIAKYLDSPTAGLTEKAGLKVLETIENAGAEAVFAQRLGPFMESVQVGITKHAPLAGLIVPFIRTPTNLVSWAIQHTPVLSLMSGRWRADFAAGGQRRADAMARVVVGGGLTLAAYSLTQQGAITGGGLFDKEMGATKRAAGWQPYSLKVGDTYYSFQRMEPVAKVLGIAADLVEMIESKKMEEADALKAGGMLALLFGNATVSTTYLSGLSDTMNAITDPDRYGEAFFEGYATSLVPKIIGQSVAMADPYKREVDGVVDAIQSQLPFLREKLLPKRDVWGEPVENNKWFNVLPVQTSKVAEEKVRTEAVRLAVAIADAPKYVQERGPFKPSEKRIELSDFQRDVFRQVSGGKAMEILSPIVNAPDWERIPDFAKAAIYQRVLEGTRKQAQWAALPPDDAGRDAVRRKMLDKIIQQTNAVE